MKKIAIVLMGIVLSIAMIVLMSITGCKETAAESTTVAETTAVETTAAETVAETEETAEKVKLIIYEFYTAEQDSLIKPYIEMFQEENPNIEVLWAHYATEDARVAFQAGVLSGAGSQLVLGPHDWAGTFAVAGILKPLDDLLDLSIYSDAVKNAGYYNGSTWGVPFESDSAVRLYYNKSIIATPPTNTDELVSIAQAATQGDITGFAYGIKIPYYYIPFLSGYGSWPLDENNAPVFDNEANIKALKLLYSWVNDNSANKVFASDSDPSELSAMFKENKLGMIISGDWDYNGFSEALGDNLDYVRLPKISDGDWPISYNSIRLFYVNKSIEGADLEAAIKFIEFMSSIEVQSKLIPNDLNKIPSTIEGVKNISAEENPVIARSAEVREFSVPMPNVPELRVVWDVLYAGLDSILEGQMTPEEGAKYMQEQADIKIEEMKAEAAK